ncbi:hypothetical protein [Ponticoccus alexandrii]|uniref:Uncharacterized protein n=1 Tax=Ponticoccus alexandrii TaxID=1943633 RepID=A0ABX7FEX7_9RHOB|nr:hypothetical protein [Ponticoccus alexandrii]QRF68169.1 hypothetical protein GQA70_18740 [Ponticoccus alexandrii]
MKLKTAAKLIAVGVVMAGAPAKADLIYPDTTPYCKDGLCFVAGKPYLAGAYKKLYCADPYKFLTYVGNRLVCKPR